MLVELRSARSRLLFRGWRRGHGDGPDLDREFFGNQTGSRLCPVLGRKLDVAVARPEGHDVDHLGEIDLGIEPVELAGGDEGEEIRGGVRVIVGAEEEPGLSPMRSCA